MYFHAILCDFMCSLLVASSVFADKRQLATEPREASDYKFLLVFISFHEFYTLPI
jgi:hypothetical protein